MNKRGGANQEDKRVLSTMSEERKSSRRKREKHLFRKIVSKDKKKRICIVQTKK